MDGVLFKPLNFWMQLHKALGTEKEGNELTKKYLHSNYDKLVQEVVHKLWKGKDATPYFKLIKNLEYLQGIAILFNHIKQKSLITAIISAGSIDAARRVQKDFGIDHIFANELVIKNNKITGEFVWPIGAGNDKKAQIIQDLANNLNIKLSEVIYIGDDDIDIEAFKQVGLSIAFNSKSEGLKKVASIVVDSDNLKDIIPLLK